MEKINVDNLKSIIESFNTMNTNKEIYWGRNDNFNLYKTIFEAETINDFKENILDTIMCMIETRKICKYDLEGSFDDVIEVIESNIVENYKIIKDKVNSDDILPINKDTKLDKFNFIYFRITLKEGKEEKTITIIKKFNKPSSVLKKSIKCIWLGDKMKQIEEDVIYLDNQVDAFEFDGNFYVINRNSFNSIFKFKDVYCRLIDKSTDYIKEIDFIDNPLNFIEKCKENGHYVKKISKAIIAKGFEDIKKHKEKIPNVIKEYNLDIKLDKDGKIIYEEENISRILDLVLDHCVRSALTDKKAIAKALEFEGE